MKNQINISTLSLFKKRLLILLQFFLIIFVYHTLKDLKDSVVITASDAGAEIIPFIKIWGMLPLAITASYLFAKLYNRFGREKTFTLFVIMLMSCYAIFAFVLYPWRNELYLNHLAEYLRLVLPIGCKGMIAMVCYWHYTFFYIAAELWSVLILSILFWGFVNEISALEEAKRFYPLCMFVGNFAGIFSGQTSYFLCHHLRDRLAWEGMLQVIIAGLAICALGIVGINHWLSRHSVKSEREKQKNSSNPFWDNMAAVFKSGPLLCIALLVVGFGLSSNLIEVVWKESIRMLHPEPKAYNAYINQLTSMIGICSVCMALLSRWIFQHLSWTKVALITPITLFFTSTTFFCAFLLPSELISPISSFFGISPILLIVTLGSIHYVLGMTAKYTIFDTTKEMAFLSIGSEDRMKAKSIIDSIGSRLGKSGASCLYQFLLIAFGSTAGHVPVIGMACVLMIIISAVATKRLGAAQTHIPSDALA